MLSSLTDSSVRQYNSGLKKWWNFCIGSNTDPFKGTAQDVLVFLTRQFHKGASYSSLNCYRSAVAIILGSGLAQNDMITRFFKGVARLRPAEPRYDSTWDPRIVLTFLSKWYPNEELPLKELTLKLVTLMALVTGHRMQTLSLIDIRNIRHIDENVIEIKIPDRIKTSAQNKQQPVLRLPVFAEDKTICVASTLQAYLRKTKELRKSITKLFISFKRPHEVVGSQTLSRWIKTAMFKSGIDVNIFTAYSTRHASTSAAKRGGVNIDLIRKTAGWSKNSTTFAKFYNRCIREEEHQFAEAILKS